MIWMNILSAASAQESASVIDDATGKALKFWDVAEPYAMGFLQLVFIMVVTWILAKWVNKVIVRGMQKAKADLAVSRFMGTVGRYAILIAGLIAGLGAVGVNVASFAAIFASAGLAVGLALQGSLSNVASGLMILFFRPFELDDVVQAAGVTGRVIDIGLFSTTMLTPDNQRIIVPNSSIMGNNIINYTAEGTRRGNVDFGVAYGADLKQVREVVLAAVNGCDLVLKEPAPVVVFTEMAASSVNFKVFAWCNARDFLAMLEQVRSASYDALNSAGIEIPFDQVVVHQASEDSA